MSSNTTQENLLFRITVEQTGSTPAQLDQLNRSLTTVVNTLKSAGTGGGSGLQNILNSASTGARALNTEINNLNTSIGKLGSGAGSAGLSRLRSEIQQTNTALLSGGRAADSYAASQQKIQNSGAPVANTLRQITSGVNLYTTAVENSIRASNTQAVAMERIVGINTQMARSNLQAAESLSMQGRQADSAAASLMRYNQAATSVASGTSRMAMANASANTVQQQGTGFDKERNAAIMQNVRSVSGMAMGFGVLAMSMDSVIGIGGMLEDQTEKVTMAEERLAQAVREHGEGSHQAEQAQAALTKAMRGHNYIQREATFAYHNMLFMIGVVALEIVSHLIPAILKVTPRIKEMIAASAGLATMKTAFSGVTAAVEGMASAIGIGSGRASSSMRSFSLSSKQEAQATETAMRGLEAAMGTVLGSSIPIGYEKAKAAGTNFNAMSRQQQAEYTDIMRRMEAANRISTGAILADTAATAGGLGREWGRASEGPKNFDTTSRTPMNNYRGMVGQVDMDTRTVTRNMGSAWQGAATSVTAAGQTIETVDEILDSNGRKVTDNVAKTAGLRGAWTALSTVGKVGLVGAITAVVASLVLYGTNMFGVRDATNQLGVSIGKLNPFIEGAGELLVGLAGTLGMTGESAQKTAGHFQKAATIMSTAWHDAIATMQQSDSELVRSIGNTVVNVNNQLTKMAGHFSTQVQASISTWGELTAAMEKGDYKRAVDIIGQALSALPGIVQQIVTDVVGVFDELQKGAEAVMTDLGKTFNTGFGALGQYITTNVNKAVTQFQGELNAMVGIATEVAGRIATAMKLDAMVQAIQTDVQKSINSFNSMLTGITVTGQAIMNKIFPNAAIGLATVQSFIQTSILQPLGNIAASVVEQGAAIASKLLGGDIGGAVSTFISNLVGQLGGLGETVKNTLFGGGNPPAHGAAPPVTELPSRFAGMPQGGGQQGPVAPNQSTWSRDAWAQQNGITTAPQTSGPANATPGYKPASFGGAAPFGSGYGGDIPTRGGVMPGLHNAGLIMPESMPSRQGIQHVPGNMQPGLYLDQFKAMTTPPQDMGASTGDSTKDLQNTLGAQQLTSSSDTAKLQAGMAEAQKAIKLAQQQSADERQQQFGWKAPSKGQVPKEPAASKFVPTGEIGGDGKPEMEEQSTLYGDVKQSVMDAKTAIGEYNAMLYESDGITKNAIGTNALFSQGLYGQELKHKELQAGIETNAGTITKWGQQLKDAGYNNDLMTAGLQEGQMQILGWQEGITKTSGTLDAYDAALQTAEMHGYAFRDGQNQQRQAFQDLQLGIDSTSGKYAELGNQITTQDALGKSFTKGVAEQDLALLNQAMSLAESAGGHARLGEQMKTNIPQMLAYATGVDNQVSALQQQVLKTRETAGANAELEAQMASGEAQLASYNQGFVEGTYALNEQQVALSQNKGSLDAFSAGIASGQVALIGFNTGLQQTREAMQQKYQAVYETSGAIKYYQDSLKTGYPQIIAWNKGFLDQKLAALQLKEEIAGLSGELQGMYAQLKNATTLTDLHTKAFLEGGKAAIEWGVNMATASSKTRGMTQGLQEIASILGVSTEAFQGNNEQLQEWIAIWSDSPDAIREAGSALYESGVEAISQLTEAISKGGEDTDKAIEEIEKKIGVDLPEGIKSALEQTALQNVLAEKLTQMLELGAAAVKNADPSAMREYIGKMQTVATEAIGQLDTQVQSRLKTVIDALNQMLAQGPTENSAEGYAQWATKVQQLLQVVQREANPTITALKPLETMKFSEQPVQVWQQLMTAMKNHAPLTAAQNALLAAGQAAGKLPPPVANAAGTFDDLGVAVEGANIASQNAETALLGVQTGATGAAAGTGQAATATTQLQTAVSTATTAVSAFAIAMGKMMDATQGTLTNIAQQFSTQFPAIFATTMQQTTTFLQSFITSFQSYFAQIGPLLELFGQSFGVAFEAIIQAELMFFERFIAMFPEQFALIAPHLEAFGLSFGVAFEAIIAAELLFFERFIAMFPEQLAQIAPHMEALGMSFQVTFDAIIQAATTFFQTFLQMTQQSVQQVGTTIQPIVGMYTTTFTQAVQNSAGQLRILEREHAVMIQKITSEVQRVVGVFTSAFQQATQAASQALQQLGNTAAQVMQQIGQRAQQAASNIGSITSSANQATSAVRQLASAINSLQDKTVTITVVTRYVTQGSPSGYATGTPGTIFMANGGMVKTGIYGQTRETRNQRVIVGESGDERVVRTGLKSNRSEVEEVRHIKYVNGLGAKEPEMLTVIPLEGTNAKRFKEKYPQYYATGTVGSYYVGSSQPNPTMGLPTTMSPSFSQTLYGRIRYDKKGNVTIDGRLVMREGQPLPQDAWQGRHLSHGSHGDDDDRSHFRYYDGSLEDIKHQGIPFSFGDATNMQFKEGLVAGPNTSAAKVNNDFLKWDEHDKRWKNFDFSKLTPEQLNKLYKKVQKEEVDSHKHDEHLTGKHQFHLEDLLHQFKHHRAAPTPGTGGTPAPGGPGSGQNYHMAPVQTMDRLTTAERVYNDFISSRVAAARDRPNAQLQDDVYGRADNAANPLMEEFNEGAMIPGVVDPDSPNKPPPVRQYPHRRSPRGPTRSFEDDYEIFMAKLINSITKKVGAKIKVNLHAQVDSRIWGKITNQGMINDMIRA
jgi:hypothetical protein